MFIFRRSLFLPLTLGLMSALAAVPARAQTAPPTLDVTKHDSVSFSDTAHTLVDDWEVRVPQGAQNVTLQLWSLQNGHLSVLQTARAYFDQSETNTVQTGRVLLLRARATPPPTKGKSGVAMPAPGLSFRFPQSRKLATAVGTFGGQKSGYRPSDRASISLPGPMNNSIYTNETQPGSGISSKQPLVLWIGQAHSQAAAVGASTAQAPLRIFPFKAFIEANNAAAREKRTPLRPLLGILNQNNPKGDTLLVLIVTWEAAAQAKSNP